MFALFIVKGDCGRVLDGHSLPAVALAFGQARTCACRYDRCAAQAREEGSVHHAAVAGAAAGGRGEHAYHGHNMYTGKWMSGSSEKPAGGGGSGGGGGGPTGGDGGGGGNGSGSFN